MRRIHLGKRSLPISLLVFVSVGLVFLGSVQFATAQEQVPRSTTATAEERIPPSEVTVDSLEAFKAQLRHDLPAGTTKKNVEVYLTRWGIRHVFIGKDFFDDRFKNTFQGAIDDIGTRRGLQARLAIYIHLDGNDTVREISFSVKYL